MTRGSGHGKSWQMTCARERDGVKKPKMIVIDPIYTDTAVDMLTNGFRFAQGLTLH